MLASPASGSGFWRGPLAAPLCADDTRQKAQCVGGKGAFQSLKGLQLQDKDTIPSDGLYPQNHVSTLQAWHPTLGFSALFLLFTPSHGWMGVATVACLLFLLDSYRAPSLAPV